MDYRYKCFFTCPFPKGTTRLILLLSYHPFVLLGSRSWLSNVCLRFLFSLCSFLHVHSWHDCTVSTLQV